MIYTFRKRGGPRERNAPGCESGGQAGDIWSAEPTGVEWTKSIAAATSAVWPAAHNQEHKLDEWLVAWCLA